MAEGEKQESYTWSMENIKDLFESKKMSFESPEFSTEITLTMLQTQPQRCVLKWRLLIKKVIDTVGDKERECFQPPKKRRGTKSSKKQRIETVKRKYLGLYLQNYDSDEDLSLPVLKITFSIIKPTAGKIYSKSKVLLKIIKEEDFGVSDFISMDELEKFNLQNLMILCEFEEVKKDIKSFESLLNNKTYSDIELRVGEKIYLGHKIVLALSSLVFREQIAKNDFLTSLEVKNIEPEVFDELLRFMYTGKVSNTEGLGLKLFKAVCKYEIWDFMTECEKVITSDLKAENIVSFLLLCYEYCKRGKINNFCNKCFFFALRNLKSIINLDAFKDLVYINSEVLALALGLLCVWIEASKCKRKNVSELLITSGVSRCSCKQYKDLLNNKMYSDIDIQVDDQKYHAHMLILGTRSPVFSKMFQHDMRETILGIIDIKDIDPQVFYEVLRFMYTNEFKSEENELVWKILIAADKYEISELKFECESILKKRLTKRNVKDTLLFADDHNAEQLKRACIFYFIDNLCLKVLNDEQADDKRPLDWSYISDFKSSHPHLLLEILNKMALDYELVFRQKK